MAKFDMTQLEKATSIPAESLHLVEMGDGSGTKAVTQEVLEEKIGEALKVGDLAQLQTEEKGNLVAAINEAAQSGGGGAAVDILDSKEEIEANTETGKAAGALAVKEMFGALNDKLSIEEWTTIKITNNGNGTIQYRKAKGRVEIIVSGWGNAPFSIGIYESVTLCVLPEEYRPNTKIPFAVSSQAKLGGSVSADGRITIQHCENNERTAYYLFGSVSYAKKN